MPESVIIAGKLTDEELKRSIDKLVEDIDEKMGNAADKFGKHLDTMQSRLKDFSTSISSLKNDVKDMSSSFDNIAKSTKAATTGSTKANASGYAPNTASNALLGELEQAKKETENLRKGFQANGTEVKRLTNQIEDLKRRIKEAKTASPKSIKEVLGMDESSVNAIATKMRALKAIQVNSKNAAEVARLGTEYQRLAKLQSDLLGRNNLLIQSNNGLARSFGYIRNRLVYALTIGAASSFVKQVYEIRGQYELLERSLGVLTNSFQKGRQIFQELNAMAIKSPFTLMDLAGAAKQLTAYNFSADEVVGTTRRLADISAALGVPMERLVYNLGQIRAQTVLTARDARDFANAGLPIVTSLANHYSELEGRIVSTGEVYDRMSKKMVSYADVMAVINKMTDEGGRFFDFQAKQANTLKVQMMNLSLAWNNMLNEIGQQHQNMLATPLSALKTLFENWRTLDKVIWDVVAVLGVVKTAQVALNLAMGTGNAAIKAQILTNKQKIASDLERKAITEALTASEQKTLLTRRQVTAADYEQVLSSRALTKQQALMMVAFRGRDAELMKALVRMNLLTAAEVRTMTTGKALTIVFRSMGLSLKTIGASMAAALPMLAATAAIGGAIHLWQTYNEQIALTAELNKELVDNAKESSDALDAFLSNKGNKAARDLAAQNKLTSDEGQKAWEAISQELKTSASSANELLSELLTIDNINERVAKGFDYAERIRQADVAMQDLKDDTIKFSQTSFWHGEGLADDLKDFANSISRYQGNYEELQDILSKQDFSSFAVRDTFTEFRNELNVTAESITDFINAHNITDPLQISEILERAKASIKSKNPEIKGELAQIFDITLDQRMAELTNNAVDKNASLWKIFLDRLKNNLGSAFDNITEENVALNGKLSQQQQQAVDKNLEYFKNTMPFYYNAVKDMVSDASKLRIQIGIAFNVQQFTDFQKEIRNRLKNAPKMIDFGSEAFLPTEKDDLVSWVDTQQKAIKKLNEENKLYEKDNSAWAKERIASNNKEISQRTSLLSLFNQSAKAEKKRRSAASGGTKKDILGGALTEEIRLISEIQKKYKEYRELGINAQDSIAKATQEYGKSLVRNNAILNKYGIQTLTSDELAKLPLQKVRDFYSEQLKIANALGNTKGIEALEKIIANINLEITKIDYKKISEGLNNELNKLKEEYELGVELDANPELGSLMLDMFDIPIETLPRTVKEYSDRATDLLNKFLKQKGSKLEIPSLLDLTDDDIRAFEKQAEEQTLSEEWVAKIKKTWEEVRAFRKKDWQETISGWNNLLGKYAEYEYKSSQIAKEANKERTSLVKKFGNEKQVSEAILLQMKIDAEEDPNKKQELTEQLKGIINDISQGNNSIIELSVAIDNREAREQAKLSFEEFQKTPDWIIATGDLATLTQDAIGELIERIQTYKKQAKNLDPKEIKKINKALKDLKKEQRKGSPFAFIANAIADAKERASEYDESINKTVSEINSLNDVQEKNGNLTEEQAKRLEVLKEKLRLLKEAQDKVGKVNATTIVSGINEAIAVAQQATQAFGEMADALGGKGLTKSAQRIKEVVGILEKGGQGAAIGAQIGGGYGAIIGGIAGTLTGIVTTYADEWSGNKSITRKIIDSEREVKRLELIYIDLQHAIDEAYGSMTIGAQKAALANKELQLAELKRQLVLEQSRKSKNRDEDKILELQKQIKDLEYDIKETTDDIVNDLLGISKVGDAMETLMDGFIEALRNGEDAMKVFDESVDDMIANMVKKMFVTKILQPWFEQQWNAIQQDIDARGSYWANMLNRQKEQLEGVKGGDAYRGLGKISREDAIKQLEDDIAQTEKKLVEETTPTLDDIKRWAALLRSGQPIMEGSIDGLNQVLQELGLFTDKVQDKNLTALQQGIQGVTEVTANALEAYMNGVSQQVYYQSDVLTQIRDAMINFNMDVQVGTMSQILLQLQSSYTVQMSIQGILEGVLNPSGRAFNVELVS